MKLKFKDKKIREKFSRKINLKSDKKASHLTMILSMVIFVGFLVFLLLIIQPALTNQNDKQFLIDSLKVKISEKISSNLTILTITNSSDPSGFDCLQIDNSDLLSEIYVKDKNNNAVDFTNNGNLLFKWGNEKFFKIYSSDETFEDYSSSFTCSNTETNYDIENLKTSSKIFETNILDLISQYNSEYTELKEELKFPLNSEFNFEFEYNNGTKIGPAGKNVSVNVFADEFSIQYVDKNAKINSGGLILKVW